MKHSGFFYLETEPGPWSKKFSKPSPWSTVLGFEGKTWISVAYLFSTKSCVSLSPGATHRQCVLRVAQGEITGWQWGTICFHAHLVRDGLFKSDWRDKKGKSGKASKGREHKSFWEYTHCIARRNIFTD